ncbi:MAG: T9SS type A sorting domain-containing protein [bacterium]|nr:T9SS type A sorting domain-containing protein [bacterium]
MLKQFIFRSSNFIPRQLWIRIFNNRSTVTLILIGIVLYFVKINSLICAPGTTWTKTYGGTKNDKGYCVQQTSDSGYIITGETYSYGAGYKDVYLIKTSPIGDTLWTRAYGGIKDDCGNSVQQTTDNGYIITGYTDSYGAGNSDVYLIKTNSSGDTLWTKTYGGTSTDWGESVQQTQDGGYIISGGTYSYGVNGTVYIIKTNSSGNVLWTKTYGMTGIDCGYSVRQTSDGGYIITGETALAYGIGFANVLFLKLNASGDTSWTKTYGGTTLDDYGFSVRQTNDGGYIIAGGTYSFGAGYADAYLVKTNSIGNTLWTKTYGGTEYDLLESVNQTSDSGYILTGGISLSGTQKDLWVLKTDLLGDTMWTKVYGGTKDDWGHCTQQTTDGGYIIVGETSSYGAGGYDVYLIKVGDGAGIEEIHKKAQSITLQNQPDPFTQSTLITYSLSVKSKVSLIIYDISGNYIKTLVNEQKLAGTYSTTLNAKELKTGVYFLTLSTGTSKTTKKLILMK